MSLPIQPGRRYGCFNRADYLDTYRGQDGWNHVAPHHATARMVDIEFRASSDCNYTLTELGRVDPKCEDCARKSVEK